MNHKTWKSGKYSHSKTIRIFGTITVLAFGSSLGETSAWAQLLQPDQTLGSEQSVIRSMDRFNDRIRGGAKRGANLFHSFREFNVGKGRGVYFASPTGIQNILSRVTGQKPSNIFGRLGVLGKANLYLLNPNGIVFGSNSSLDIQGSFVGTTANAIALGDQGLFSASEPYQSSLLSVNPGILFFNQVSAQSGSILNHGNLSVGKNLTLSGHNLDLQGELGAGHNLILQAQETLLARDASLVVPGGSTTLWGEHVSIEGQSRIDVSSAMTGGKVLIGQNRQGGSSDPTSARIFVGPEVTIDADALVDGDGGHVVLDAEEVVGFYGQINARGGARSGKGGFVEVSGQEHVLFRGDVETSAPQGTTGLFVLDPVNIVIANGSGDGQLDGLDTFAGNQSGLAGAVLSTPLSEFNDRAPTTIYESELEGLSGETNISLQATNDIQVEDLVDDELTFARGSGFIELIADADQDGTGSFVIQDFESDKIVTSSRDIEISGAILRLGGIVASNNLFGDGGNVDLKAQGDITTHGEINTSSIPSQGKSNKGGNISISSTFGNITTKGELRASSKSSTGDSGNGGNISIFTKNSGFILTERGLNNGSSAETGDSGQAGIINVSSVLGNITSKEGWSSGSQSPSGNSGQGGKIFISTKLGHIKIDGGLFANSGAQNNSGQAGIINISSDFGNITIDKNLFARSRSRVKGDSGQGGTIHLQTNGHITTNQILDTQSFVDDRNDGNSGQGGNIKVSSGEGNITANNQGWFTNSRSQFGNAGQGGDITVSTKKGDIEININFTTTSKTQEGNSGKGGDIKLSSDSGDITTNSGDITTTGLLITRSQTKTGNSGKGGDITIHSGSGDIKTNNVLFTASLSKTGDSGQGGNIKIETDSGHVTINRGSLFSISESEYGNSGRGGNIVLSSGKEININRKVISLNSSSFSEKGTTNKAGNISLRSKTGSIRGHNTPVFAISVAQGGGKSGKGGTVTIESDQISGLDVFTLSSKEKSGQLTIKSSEDSLFVNNLNVTTSVQGEFPDPFNPFNSDQLVTLDFSNFGQAGNTSITSPNRINLNNVKIQSDSNGSNKAGNITIESPGQIKLINSQINSNANRTGAAGNIRIMSDSGISLSNKNSTISAQTQSSENDAGDGGNITIEAPQFVTLGAKTQLNARTDGAGKAGKINIVSGKVTIGKDAEISATAGKKSTNSAGGGDINIETSQLNISGKLGIFAETEGQAPAGTLTIKPDGKQTDLKITFIDNGSISASTSSNGTGGDINISAPKVLNISGFGKIDVTSSGSGNSGDINIHGHDLTLAKGVEITASSTKHGNEGKIGNAGNITIDLSGQFNATNSEISTKAKQASGGNVEISAETMRLNNSDIETSVAGGVGGGGNIRMKANSIVAMDDTDFLASAKAGKGGNITLETPAFIGESYDPSPKDTDLNRLDGNGVVNINASGTIDGEINIPDVSFIEESLTELPQAPIDTSILLSNSCIVRSKAQQGKFIFTGAVALPKSPEDRGVGSFSTIHIQTTSNPAPSFTSPVRPWQIGDPIVEPEAVYRLPEGQLIASRDCSK